MKSMMESLISATGISLGQSHKLVHLYWYVGAQVRVLNMFSCMCNDCGGMYTRPECIDTYQSQAELTVDVFNKICSFAIQ